MSMLLLAGGADAATDIDECGTISAPGEYILNRSIINSPANSCITIDSSDVILDGAGFTIDGVNASITYGIHVNEASAVLTNVTVKNLEVTNWYYGIYYTDTSNGNITNNTANSNTGYGIYLESSSNYNTVANNIANSDRIAGISLRSSSDYNTLTSNTVNSNGYGIMLFGPGSYNTLINNTANSNSYYGISLSDSNDHILTNNTANSNGYNGIDLSSSSNNILTSNTANSNSYGIMLSGSSNYNTLANNNASSNQYGFSLAYSGNTIIANNTATWNNYGIYLDSSTSNTLTDNLADSNDDTGIYLASSSSNSLSGNHMGNNTRNFRIDGWSDTDFSQDIDISNTVNGKPVYYLVGASGATYDSSTNAGWFGCVSCDNVTVKDLVLMNNSPGLLFLYTSNSEIKNVTVKDNYWGIWLEYSDNNNITSSPVRNNAQYGVNIQSSNGNIFDNDDIIHNCGGDAGVYMSSGNSNTFKNSNISYSSGYGFKIYDSDQTTFLNNTINSNGQAGQGDGVYTSYSSYDIFSGNTINSNADDGLHIEGYGESNTNITGNNISNNGEYGIYLDHEDNALVDNNTLYNNIKGIYLYSSWDNTITNNIEGSNNFAGIYFEGSSGNILINNTARNNAQWDFFSELNSINNTVIDLAINPTISFTGKDVAIRSVSSPARDPDGYSSIGEFVEVTNNSGDSWLFINMSYSDADVTYINESMLRMWKYEQGSWSPVLGMNDVVTEENYVYANITGFSVFAPMWGSQLPGTGAPDLAVASLTVPSEVKVNSTANISVRVLNLGSVSSNLTKLYIYEGSTPIQNITMPPLNAGEATDYVARWTPSKAGTKLIMASIDPDGTTKESNEGNNKAKRWVTVGERDLRVFIYSANRAISGTNETAWIYVTKYGNLRTDVTDLTVNISTQTDSQTYIFSIPELVRNGETNVTTINVPIRSNTTINAFVTPVDESNVTNNNATRVVESVSHQLNIKYIYRPSWQVWANTTFWTGVRFSSNAETSVDATIQLQDGLTLPVGERRTKRVYAGVSDWNWVTWNVNVPDDYGTYGYNITISAYSANDTANARVSTLIPLATLKDFNSTIVKNGTNKTLTFASFNVTSFRSSYNLTLIGGNEGRVLSGLEYLFDYPYGCVEQTSSPTLAGLKIKKYYENNGLWDEDHHKTEITNKILSGLNRLKTMQATSGAFAIWGGETGDDALPTIYAYYAISRGLHDSDTNIRDSTAIIDMNPDKIASWIAANQKEDGSWESHYWYASYYTRTVLTGIALMDYNLSESFLNDSVRASVNTSREKAAQFLLDSQRPDGSWTHSNSGVEDPYVTGFGLLGLAYSGNQSTNVTDTMNRSIALLESAQNADGYWEGTAIYKAWSATGIRSETTAVALQALIAAGVPTDNEHVVNAANYLTGVYEHDRSWGYTKTTQEAIQALLKVMRPETLDLNVSVNINGNTSVYYINSSNRTVVNITVTCADRRVCTNAASINAIGSGSVVVNVGGTQIIKYREKDLVPSRYVDPIDEDLSINVTIATGIEKEPTLINVSINNPTSESVFSPIITVPLNNTMLSGNIKDKRTGENVHYETINDTLYIEPVIVGNRTTESYLFNLTFNNSGYQTVQAEFAPMYNPTLLTLGNGTGYIKGHGNMNFTVYDGYGDTINSSINVSNSTNSNLPNTNLVEGNYDVNISSANYISALGHVSVSSDVNRSYILRMFRTLNQPEVVLSEFDARPAFMKASTNASTGMIEYDMTVSTRSKGVATVAMTIPENLNLSLAQVDSQVVPTETFNNTVYITTNVGDGSIVSLLFSLPENVTVSCLIDVNRSCSSRTTESELEIHSSFNASEGSVSTSTTSNASTFGADDSSLINSREVGFRYLNITYSNLTFDWAIIKIFYYSDEITNKSVNEDTLEIYWYNYNSGSWLVLDNGSDYSNINGPYVYAAAISKAVQGRGYAWANVTHFSTFALAGAQVTSVPAEKADHPASSYGTGGGVITYEPYENIARAERYEKSLVANSPITYEFIASELGIYEIAVTGRESENDITLRVEALKGRSKLVSIDAPGTVYKNLNIWAGTKRIKDAKVRFKVQNSWLARNDLESKDVKILKWDGSEWVQLETREISIDASYRYYETKTDTFSHFAISGLKGVAVPTITPSGTAPGITPKAIDALGVTEKAAEKAEPVNLVVIIAVVMVLIAIAAVLYLKRK